jgi:hypothetical protein
VSALPEHRYVGAFTYKDGAWYRKPQRLVTLSSARAIDWKSAVPWVVGGAAVILAAVYLTRGKKSAPRAAARRRSTPTWRRRITTTWR